MQKMLALAVLLLAVMGCNLSKYVGNANSASPTPHNTKPLRSATPVPEATPAVPSYLAMLKRSVGKYPYEIKLLDNAELKPRLKKLLGSDFSDMKEHWNVESPIAIENGIVMTTGCEAHNCGANSYLMFIDLENDNINVFHTGDEGTKHYYEGGEIELPRKFAAELSPDR